MLLFKSSLTFDSARYSARWKPSTVVLHVKSSIQPSTRQDESRVLHVKTSKILFKIFLIPKDVKYFLHLIFLQLLLNVLLLLLLLLFLPLLPLFLFLGFPPSFRQLALSIISLRETVETYNSHVNLHFRPNDSDDLPIFRLEKGVSNGMRRIYRSSKPFGMRAYRVFLLASISSFFLACPTSIQSLFHFPLI